MTADPNSWNEEWRDALRSSGEANGVGDVRYAGGFMIVGDRDDARDE